MAFTEFYCDFTNGSNLNAGDDAGSPSMVDTAGTGAVSTVTHQYTSVATNGSVAVGQFISIFSGAATVPAFVSRITAVSGGGGAAWVITYSTTAKSGNEPTTGGTYKANVGGAWKGPNAAAGHPFNFVTAALKNAAGDVPRVNLKNNATYAISTKVTQSAAGPIVYQGYGTTVADGGKAIIDGSTNAITLLEINGADLTIADLICQNNGTTGSQSGISIIGNECLVFRCVVNNVRFYGFAISGAGVMVLECEAYACNTSNTDTVGGFLAQSTTVYFYRCISHDNSGSLNDGFVTGGSICSFNECIADTNGKNGFSFAGAIFCNLSNCTSYNNGVGNNGVGLSLAGTISVSIQNCAFVANGTYGISGATTVTGILLNNGYHGNGTAETLNMTTPIVIGSVSFASSPFVDPANGDFRVTLASAINGGRGSFTQTAASYAGTVSYPDIGAVQHLEGASGGGTSPIGLGSPVVRAI